MEEMFSNTTEMVNSFIGWVGSTERYGQYWIMLHIVVPAVAWTVIAWLSLWLKHSQYSVVRTAACVTWWMWLVASGMLFAYLAIWSIAYALVTFFWLELSGGLLSGWGHDLPLPLWVWVLFAATIVVACVTALEHRPRRSSMGLGIFWWIDASADLAPDDDTLTDLPIVQRV